MESFWVTYLTTSGFCVTDIWGGSIERVNMPMREVTRRALDVGAIGVLLTHNHPSGDGRPSEADKRLTAELCDTLGHLGIRVLDHIIIANGQLRSFRDMNLIWLASPQGGRRTVSTPVPITSRRSDPITFTCQTCFGVNVTRDARSEWDATVQRWVLRDVFDYAHCHTCDTETALREANLPNDSGAL